MNWTKLLKSEIESTYASTAKLLDRVDPKSLDWKPASGGNWMTVGQLLEHTASARAHLESSHPVLFPPGKRAQFLDPGLMHGQLRFR